MESVKGTMGLREMRTLLNRAHEAGTAAGSALSVAPMVVQQHADMMDDKSPVVQQWEVEGGPCGFAWVSLFKVLGKKRALAMEKGFSVDHYAGGLRLSVMQFGQSMAKKEAYAEAYAAVLREAGFSAYAGSRMD